MATILSTFAILRSKIDALTKVRVSDLQSSSSGGVGELCQLATTTPMHYVGVLARPYVLAAAR